MKTELWHGLPALAFAAIAASARAGCPCHMKETQRMTGFRAILRKEFAHIRRDPATIVFLSDIVEELDAAREARMRTVLVDRLEDYPQPRTGEATHGHARVTGFAEIELPA